ncbi:peritrophin-1-like [Onthophagus taurus]|uniref:peritrophin-1-like n=1 Tax=Onthophagus taurus TaxID=166361 RepID=UPI0039BE5F7D
MKAVAVLFLLGIIGIGADPVGVCPSVHSTYVDFLLHSTDPTKFYYCVWGTPVLFTCPAGLHFNITLGVCDWPAAPPVPPTPPTTTETTTTDTTTIAPSPGGCASVTCPFTPGTFPVFHVHPTNPNRYCKCDNFGIVHDMPCPAGLVFNPILNVCDW